MLDIYYNFQSVFLLSLFLLLWAAAVFLWPEKCPLAAVLVAAVAGARPLGAAAVAARWLRAILMDGWACSSMTMRRTRWTAHRYSTDVFNEVARVVFFFLLVVSFAEERSRSLAPIHLVIESVSLADTSTSIQHRHTHIDIYIYIYRTIDVLCVEARPERSTSKDSRKKKKPKERRGG